MEQHFRELDEAAKTKSRKIAWCTSVGPAELLRAAGFLVFFPENHGAMLGATRMATDLIPTGQRHRLFARHLLLSDRRYRCVSQRRSPISKAYPGISGPPRPDVLVLQHQSMPRRARLVQFLRARIQCSRNRRSDASWCRRYHESACRFHFFPDQGARSDAGGSFGQETGLRRIQTHCRPVTPMHGSLEGSAADRLERTLSADVF